MFPIADEIHTTRESDGTTHATTVVDREPRRGGAGLILIVLVALALVALIAFQLPGNQRAQTDGVTEAAQKVGDAAQDAIK
jgi:hypothetical protein